MHPSAPRLAVLTGPTATCRYSMLEALSASITTCGKRGCSTVDSLRRHDIGAKHVPCLLSCKPPKNCTHVQHPLLHQCCTPTLQPGRTVSRLSPDNLASGRACSSRVCTTFGRPSSTISGPRSRPGAASRLRSASSATRTTCGPAGGHHIGCSSDVRFRQAQGLLGCLVKPWWGVWGRTLTKTNRD